MNFEELARCTDDFNGAQLKAVCVEAVSCELAVVFVLHFVYFIVVTGHFSQRETSGSFPRGKPAWTEMHCLAFVVMSAEFLQN